VAPPLMWGDPNVVRERLGSAVRGIRFDRRTMLVPALSVQHQRELVERAAGPVRTLVESLSDTDTAKLEAFRSECDALAAEYFHDNVLRQDYLMTRAIKV
jgi:hypothetical protein